MILAIDPGLASCGWATVTAKGRITSAGTIHTPSNTALFTRLARITAMLVTVVLVWGVTHVVIEAFTDQGTSRKMFTGRWKTPMVIGAILNECGHLDAVTYLEVAPNQRIRPYGEIIEMWKRGTFGIVPGDEALRRQSEHARDAAAHGLAYLETEG